MHFKFKIWIILWTLSRSHPRGELALLENATIAFFLLTLFSSLWVRFRCGSGRGEVWLVVAIAHDWVELGVEGLTRIPPGCRPLGIVAMGSISAEATKALPSPT